MPIITITIGSKLYGIPEYYVRKIPRLSKNLSAWNSDIALPDIHEDVGHTIIHFLYSGSYETIISPLERGVDCIAREYRRSVLVYEAARAYDIPDLGALARKYIEHFGEALSLFDILRTVKEVFSKLPEDESWLPLYVKQKLNHIFLFDESTFTDDEFFGILGEDRYFSNAVFKMTLDIYSTRLQFLESEPTHQNSNSGNLDLGHTRSESPAAKHDAEGYPPMYDAPVPEEPVSEEPFADNSSPAELYPDEYRPQPEPEAASPQPLSVDDYAEEPVAEPCPVEDHVPEAPTAPVPGSVDDYSDELAAEPCPVEDYVPEPSSPEPYPEHSQAEPTTEEPASPLEPHVVRMSTSANMMANISLYNDWEKLSKKGKVKRRRKLRMMGLPVPK